MPRNKYGDHYANPAVGKMMEAGGKPRGEMSAYDKEAEYRKAGYMISKLEIEYAENGFVVKCYWEYPKKMKKGNMEAMPGHYMEPTVKVFKTVPELQKFVKTAFNDYRHGYSGAYPKTGPKSARTSVTSKSRKKGNPHGKY